MSWSCLAYFFKTHWADALREHGSVPVVLLHAAHGCCFLIQVRNIKGSPALAHCYHSWCLTQNRMRYGFRSGDSVALPSGAYQQECSLSNLAPAAFACSFLEKGTSSHSLSSTTPAADSAVPTVDTCTELQHCVLPTCWPCRSTLHQLLWLDP